MKVILKENVYKHGVAGDVVNVADGFARNYLIPRKLAVKATAGALRENAQLMQNAVLRRQELNDTLSDVARQIDGIELVFGVKAGKNGKLYGSITTMDIAHALEEKTGIDINRRRISERPLRELGPHDVPVRMSADITPHLRIVIVREEELAEYLAKGSLSQAGAEVVADADVSTGEVAADVAADSDITPETEQEGAAE
jgi:large subunit ribosomal protein L9